MTLPSFFQKIKLLVETEETFKEIAILDESYFADRTFSLMADFEELTVKITNNGALQQEADNFAFNYFSEAFSVKISSSQRLLAFDLIASGFVRKLVSPTKAVEQLFEILKSLQLAPQYKNVFVDSMAFLEKVIPLLTYKDCQTVMCHVLTALKFFKNCVKPDRLSRAAAKVLSIFFNRENPVLPTFLVYGVVHMTFGHLANNPDMENWIFYNHIFGYRDSFQLLAKLFTISGRIHFRPIIQHTYCNFTPIHYKLDSTDLVFKLSDTPLPYDRELNEPLKEWVSSLLLEPFCVHMPEKSLLIPEKPGARRPGLEKCCIELAVQLVHCANTNNVICTYFNNNMIILFTRNMVNFTTFIKGVFSELQKSTGKVIVNASCLTHLIGSFLYLNMIFNNQGSPISADDLNTIIQIDEILSDADQMSSFSIDTSGPFEMARFVLWSSLLHRLRLINQPDVSPPKELLKHFNQLQSMQQVTRDTSRQFLVNILNVSLPNSEMQKKTLAVLLEVLTSQSMPLVTLVGNCSSHGELEPLDFSLMKQLNASSRVMLGLHINTHWKHMVSTYDKLNRAPLIFFSPALIETYARLYMDSLFEALHVPMIDDIIIASTKSNSTYRTFPIIMEILVQYLPHYYPLGSLTCYQHCINIIRSNTKFLEYTQFYTSLENSCIHIMSSFGIREFNVQIEKNLQNNQLASLISVENEDYNKLFMLNVIRSMAISGVDCFDKWYKQIFDSIQNTTPHVLSYHMLTSVPNQIQTLYYSNPYFQSEIYHKLKSDVDFEFGYWKKLRNDTELINYFATSAKGHYFLCIFWKLLIADEPPPLIAAAILEKIGPKNLTKHIRTFCEFVICEMLANMSIANRCVAAINRMIWEYHVMSVDRFLFTMILRPFGLKEDKVSVYSLHLFLQNSLEFKERVDFFCNDYNHNSVGVFAGRHMNFAQKYPEHFFFEGLYRAFRQEPQTPFYFPSYFSNVCIRFCPVFDLIIHRFLEIPEMLKHLQPILASYGKLFKFHQRPISYLFSTVAFYKKTIVPEAIRLLLTSMHEAFNGIKPAEWLVSAEFLANAVDNTTFLSWNPAPSYLNTLIEKLTLAILTPSKCEPYCQFNWSLEEFTSVSSHLLYSTCLELLSLPNLTPSNLAPTLFDLALNDESGLFNEFQRLNSVSLILNNLPPNYSIQIEDSMMDLMKSETILNLTVEETLKVCSSSDLKDPVKSVIVTVHCLYYHANNSHLNFAKQFFTEKLKPLVRTEQQLVLYCHLLCPLFLRHADNKPILSTIYSDVIDLVKTLGNSSTSPKLVTEDLIVDLLYFGKYNCLGDDLKSVVDSAAMSCGKSLQTKLKFY